MKQKSTIYLSIWFLANIIFFVSLLLEHAFLSLLGVIFIELISFHNIDKRAINEIYTDVSVPLNLLRIGLFAHSIDNHEVLLLAIIFEILFLPLVFFPTYLKYFVTSLPIQNYKNFGKLESLQKFYNRLGAYTCKRNNIRLIMYLLIIFLWYQGWVLALSLCFLIILVISLKIAIESIYYLKYLTSVQYSTDLLSHTNFHDPEVVIYFAATNEYSYQLDQWVPVLKRLKKRVTVIVRDQIEFDSLKKSPLHVVYARSMDDIENFLSESTRLCLYPGNAMKNAHMMRNVGLKHIFINHGESDKVVNQSRFVNAYDKLYLAGKLAKDRMVGFGFDMPEEKYAYIGRPQASLILKDEIGVCNNILYAPTWEGFSESANYCSVGKMGLSLVKDIINNTRYNVIFKPHSLTGSVDFSLKKKIEDISSLIIRSNRGEVLYSGDILESMNKSDILITDISSVLNDFLFTGRPYLVTNPNNVNEMEYVAEFRSLSAAYIVNAASANSVSMVISSIAGDDAKKEERIALKRYSLGDFDMSSFDKFELELNNDYISMQ